MFRLGVPPGSRCWLQSLAGRANRQNALAPPCGRAKLSLESRRILHKTVWKSPPETQARTARRGVARRATQPGAGIRPPGRPASTASHSSIRGIRPSGCVGRRVQVHKPRATLLPRTGAAFRHASGTFDRRFGRFVARGL